MQKLVDNCKEAYRNNNLDKASLECLLHNNNLLEEVCKQTGIEYSTALEQGAEYCDGLIRDYLLPQAISKAIDNRADEFDKCFEELEEYSGAEDDIHSEIYKVASEIANEIKDKGIMNFEEIDDLAAEKLGLTLNKFRDEQYDVDTYGILSNQGINKNFSTGDFYTDEYEKEHPEVAEDYEESEEDQEQ